MMAVRLYLLQRFTAALMVPLIVVHLALIFYATRSGVTAVEILGRTRGSVLWGAYYATFVAAAAIHGAIGVRAVLREWGPAWIERHPRRLDASMWGFGLVLLGLGLRAVYAVIAP
jgi:fumarate reductase subunit C